MSDQPKRPRGRPPSPNPRTAAERMADSRARRGRNTLEMPDSVAALLDAQAAHHGDRSRLAVVERLLAGSPVPER